MSVEDRGSEGRQHEGPVREAESQGQITCDTIRAADGNRQPCGGTEGGRQEEWQAAALTNTAYQFHSAIMGPGRIWLAAHLSTEPLQLRKAWPGITAA